MNIYLAELVEMAASAVIKNLFKVKYSSKGCAAPIVEQFLS